MFVKTISICAHKFAYLDLWSACDNPLRYGRDLGIRQNIIKNISALANLGIFMYVCASPCDDGIYHLPVMQLFKSTGSAIAWYNKSHRLV